MLETKIIEVDGVQYRHTLLDARKGRTLYYRLIQSLAPTLDKLDLSKDVDPGLFITRFVASAIAGLGPELFDSLCDACAESTMVLRPGGEDSLSKVFSTHFAGRYSSLMRWLLETVRANGWLDFLEEIFKAGLSGLASELRQGSESPKT